MLRKIILLLAGSMLAVLGLAGLVLPVLPGVLLLLAAVICFAAASRRVEAGLHRHLQRNPQWQLAWRRWRASRGLPALTRLRLAFWLMLDGLVTARR